MEAVIASFAVFLLGFTAIGLLSARRRKDTTEDYLVAGRSVSPWLTALSSVATNNSGFMFIGLIGFAYTSGLKALWLQLGWLMGDMVAWAWVHRRIRITSGKHRLNSVPALVGTHADGTASRPIVIVAAILTLFFLGGYAAAQLKAGSTTLTVLFGWDESVGALIGAFIVVAYCFAGGLRASIWTDAAQSIVMIIAMAVLVGVGWSHVGGPGDLVGALEAKDAVLVDPSNDLAFGTALYILGFAFGGFAAIGQPHIVIRSMAIEAAEAVPKARLIYFVWLVPFSFACIATGLYANIMLPELLEGVPKELVEATAEQALPQMAMTYLPEVLIGVTLAGIFAATMSTADSQLLACSAAVTQDLVPRWRHSVVASKVATLAVAALALTIALAATKGVFDLVLLAWAALGASIGPVLLVRVMGGPLPGWLGVVMMLSGILTVVVWGESPWGAALYKQLPGMAVPLILYGGWWLIAGRRAHGGPHWGTRADG